MSSQHLHQITGLQDGFVQTGKLFVVTISLLSNHIYFETDTRTTCSEKVPPPKQFEIAILPASVSTATSSASKVTESTFEHIGLLWFV